MKRFLLEKAHRNWQTYLSEAEEEVAKAAEASADASTALSDLHKQAQDAQKEKASALSDLADASKDFVEASMPPPLKPFLLIAVKPAMTTSLCYRDPSNRRWLPLQLFL